ncbi:hypothetical protein LIER_29851 [Lithospermum erythrorhizon]|uniref:endo-polygalacturonase n=1 Tax=Lithospermum erythrorhizon TaxID=34254 RepID=A0AAV3RM40_LITER
MRSFFPHPSNHSILFILIILHIFVHLLLNIDSVDCFDPLIKLRTKGYLRKSSVELNVDDYGAKGDGVSDDTKIFRDIWKNACSLPSNPKIVVPTKKSYLVGPIEFPGPCKSKVTLKISGAIVAPKDPDVWNCSDTSKWIYFSRVKHLTVEGGGTINGMGQEWWSRSCKTNASNPCRHAPTAITFHKCNNLKVRKIMVLDSQQMHMSFTSCTKVAASHLNILAPGSSPNTDGIHISASSSVEVKESTISTGDDCISIVSNSSKICIKDISCGPGHGISIGSLGKGNSWDQVQDVTVSGVLLSNTDNGVRIKTWQGGSGYAKKITFQNIRMENVSNPIIIDQYYCDSKVPCSNQTLSVKIQDISFIDIKGTSASEEAIRFECSDTSPCKKLYLEDIQLQSCSENATTSFCWQASGSSSGQVSPPPCFASRDNGIQNYVMPTSLNSL